MGSVPENLARVRAATQFGSGALRCCEGTARWPVPHRCQGVAVKGSRFCQHHGGARGLRPNTPGHVARRIVRRAVRSGAVPAELVQVVPVLRDTLGRHRKRALASALAARVFVEAFVSGDPEARARVLAELNIRVC